MVVITIIVRTDMINQNRRTLLKTLPLLAAFPVASLSALESNQEKVLNNAESSKYFKREFTLTNLTPNTLTLDKRAPISVPAYNDSSFVKFDVSKACGAKIAPGEDITFDVIVAKDRMLDVSIDEVELKSDQLDSGNIISAMNFTAQISII